MASAPPSLVERVKDGLPLVVLEFELAGDRNVLDVAFADGVPVASDYH